MTPDPPASGSDSGKSRAGESQSIHSKFNFDLDDNAWVARLRERIGGLLKGDRSTSPSGESARNEMESPDETVSVDPSTNAPPDAPGRPGAHAPPQIGPYKILRTLGEGGMGTVYLAEQTKPIHRQVALKIIKLGMDTRQVIARFDAEREALALMNHPNVARVIDAGATATGRPFFVMEYVEGVPLTAYCDAKRLSTHERLGLFVQVCQAIQHAHQKGIIHRDIKPSNVMVTEVDGKPTAKVIDFGIAKATQQRLTEATCFTEQGQLIGTPAYMSPEQADARSQDIDTRTDIYSLGVLLYEMLVGDLPFDAEELRRAAMTEIVRIICEVDPPKPSTRLAALGATSTTIADLRGTTRIALARQLRGDLDWIVMKALEKDRSRRYETANAMALEIHRYLNNEPVLAGPPSVSYRLKKFVRRNRLAVAGSAILLISLTAGLIGTSLMYVRASRAEQGQRIQREYAEEERKRAVDAEHLSSERLTQAEQARVQSESVTAFLSGLLASAEPGKERRDVTLREVLDKASTEIADKFVGMPQVEGHLRNTMAIAYQRMGLYDAAESQLVTAAAILQDAFGESNPETLKAVHNLVGALIEHGKLNESDEPLIRTLEVRRRVLGEEHPETLQSFAHLARSLHTKGRYQEAEATLSRLLEAQTRIEGEEHPSTLFTKANLAAVYHDQGRFDEAELLTRQVLEARRRVLGNENPFTLQSTANLASIWTMQGRLPEAEAQLIDLLSVERRVFGNEHPYVLTCINTLGLLYFEQGRYTEAESLYLGIIDVRRRVLGETHLSTLSTLQNLADVYANDGRLVEAEKQYSLGLETSRRVHGGEHMMTLTFMTGLTDLYIVQNRIAEAESLLENGMETARRILGEDHPVTAYFKSSVGATYAALGRFSEAEPLLLTGYERLKNHAGPNSVTSRRVTQRIVQLYESWDAAEPGKGYDEKAGEWKARLPIVKPQP